MQVSERGGVCDCACLCLWYVAVSVTSTCVSLCSDRMSAGVQKGLDFDLEAEYVLCV